MLFTRPVTRLVTPLDAPCRNPIGMDSNPSIGLSSPARLAPIITRHRKTEIPNNRKRLVPERIGYPCDLSPNSMLCTASFQASQQTPQVIIIFKDTTSATGHAGHRILGQPYPDFHFIRDSLG